MKADERGDHFESLGGGGVDEMIILKGMLKKEKSGNSWTGLFWLRIGISGVGGVGRLL
jgi:hypothetical protein